MAEPTPRAPASLRWVPASIRRITLAFFAVLAILLIPAAQAGAQGNAGIDQYTETPPAADGEGDAAAFGDAGGGGSSGAGDNDDGGQPLPSDSRDDLESLGSDGVAAADIAEATAPESGSGGNGGDGNTVSVTESSSPASKDSGSGDGVGGVIDALGGSGSDGLGIAFPLILVLSLLGVAGFLVARGRVGDPRG
jgi:hypothetical protein